eukprot:COSAG06_NODE_4780_length_3960_cov_25.428904_3_plen_226_part_00
MLPVALSTGEQNASKRLSVAGIFCLNPKRIAIAGKVRVFCFDKTGTLTLEGLEFQAAQWCEDSSGGGGGGGSSAGTAVLDASVEAAASSPTFSFPMFDAAAYSEQRAPLEVLRGMACCHAVTVAPSFTTQEASSTTDPSKQQQQKKQQQQQQQQEFSGNEVEVRMFTATGWSLIEGGGREGQQKAAAQQGGGGGLAQVLSPTGEDSLEIMARCGKKRPLVWGAIL